MARGTGSRGRICALVAIKIHEITFRSLNILQTFCILRLSEIFETLRRVYNRKEGIKVIKSEFLILEAKIFVLIYFCRYYV